MPMGMEASPWAGSEILRLKKEAFAADGLGRRQWDVPGGMELWLKVREEAKAAEDAQLEKKKRKKVVKTRLTPNQIMKLRAIPCRTVDDISDDTLASKSESLRRLYTMRWYIDGKWSDYFNALFRQYDLLGYVEDEDEVSDDEVEQAN